MVLRNSIPQSFRKLLHSKRGVVSTRRREYHDQSFGFRERREYVFPDCKNPIPPSSAYSRRLKFQLLTPIKDTLTQLKNRSENAHLLRYVDSMRMHGHRAAKIDPLDFIHRDQVAVLGSERYGLTDDNKRYDVNGILWTKRVGEYAEGEGEEFWTLKEIKDHLTNIYVGNVGYEVCQIFSFLVFKLGFSNNSLTSSCILLRKRNVAGFLTCSSLKHCHLQKTSH